MTLAAIGKTLAWIGRLADMILDGVRAATTQIVFGLGTEPAILGSDEIRSSRWIAVATIACTAGGDLHRTVDVQGLVHEDGAVAVPGRIDVRVATTGCADRSGRRESRWNCHGRMATG